MKTKILTLILIFISMVACESETSKLKKEIEKNRKEGKTEYAKESFERNAIQKFCKYGEPCDVEKAKEKYAAHLREKIQKSKETRENQDQKNKK